MMQKMQMMVKKDFGEDGEDVTVKKDFGEDDDGEQEDGDGEQEDGYY